MFFILPSTARRYEERYLPDLVQPLVAARIIGHAEGFEQADHISPSLITQDTFEPKRSHLYDAAVAFIPAQFQLTSFDRFDPRLFVEGCACSCVGR